MVRFMRNDFALVLAAIFLDFFDFALVDDFSSRKTSFGHCNDQNQDQQFGRLHLSLTYDQFCSSVGIWANVDNFTISTRFSCFVLKQLNNFAEKLRIQWTSYKSTETLKNAGNFKYSYFGSLGSADLKSGWYIILKVLNATKILLLLLSYSDSNK